MRTGDWLVDLTPESCFPIVLTPRWLQGRAGQQRASRSNSQQAAEPRDQSFAGNRLKECERLDGQNKGSPEEGFSGAKTREFWDRA
jgi:hypothetical protein